MPSDLIRQIKERMQDTSTEELQAIWVENDHTRWSPEAFEAIREILQERGVTPPAQAAAIEPPARVPLWRSFVRIVATGVLVVGAIVASFVPASLMYPLPVRSGAWLPIITFLFAALALTLGLQGIRMRLRFEPPSRLSLWFGGWFGVAVVGVLGCLALPFTDAFSRSEGTFVAAGIVAPSICLLLVPSYRPRMLLVLALMIATAASAGAVPGMAETRAMGLARQRVADVKQLEDRLSIGLTEAVFDAALLSPMKSTVSLPASKRAIVCYAEKRGDRYALVVTPYASFFPDDWEMTSLDAASYVFVLHDGIEVKRPLRAVEAPVLVYRLPDYELVASGSVSLGLWHRADADPFGWSDVHKLRSLMAQVVRILVGAKP